MEFWKVVTYIIEFAAFSFEAKAVAGPSSLSLNWLWVGSQTAEQ